ncbi:MAG TPA: DJ-1/PfpI family protein [Pyrinomonadaceae bacterium]
MSKQPPDFNITIPIYEQVNLFDVTSACEMFYWMGQYWTERTVAVRLVSANGCRVKTHAGPILTPDESFDSFNQKGLVTHLIWVPGAGDDTISGMMKDTHFLDFVSAQAKNAEYVTSVCEGALLLATAGLLDGYSATTHWSVVPCLRQFKNVTVADDYPRFVVDRNRVTGGGVSSGIDESLEIIRIVAGEKIAKQAQVVTQYFPQPPVMGQIPCNVTCDIDIPTQTPAKPSAKTSAKKR